MLCVKLDIWSCLSRRLEFSLRSGSFCHLLREVPPGSSLPRKQDRGPGGSLHLSTPRGFSARLRICLGRPPRFLGILRPQRRLPLEWAEDGIWKDPEHCLLSPLWVVEGGRGIGNLYNTLGTVTDCTVPLPCKS